MGFFLLFSQRFVFDLLKIKHHDAQVEWNQIKENEELVKEKIEEYLQIYNDSGALPDQGLARPPSPTSTKPKRKVAQKKKGKRRSNENESDEEERGEKDDNWSEADEQNDKDDEDDDEEEENNDDDDDDDDFDDYEEEKPKKTKTKKKSYYVKKRKAPEDEIIEDPSKLAQVTGTPLEPLAKQKRQPAQEKAYKELSEINEKIASLVQVRQMGLSTPDNKKQLKQLMIDRKKKAYELKRLQSKQKASNKYRMKRRKIVRNFLMINRIEEKQDKTWVFFI